MTIRAFSIVCVVDLGEQSFAVIEHAIAEALKHEQVNVHMVTVVDQEGDTERANRELRQVVYEVLPTFTDENAEAVRNLRFHVRCGAPHERIVELGTESRADLILIGRFGGPHPEGESLDTAAKVVQNAECSVQVVQSPSYEGVHAGQCAVCVAVRAQSAGEKWFCEKHSDKRVPRLADQLGNTSYTPGWGII